jgi:hypothetical protein
MLDHRGAGREFVKPIAWIAIGVLAAACVHEEEMGAPYPAPIEAAKAEYVADCAPSKPHFDKDLIFNADFNGDGLADFVVNGFAYRCRGDTPFCGSAGCDVQVFLSQDETWVQSFRGHLRERPHLEEFNGRTTLSGWQGRLDPD